MTHADLDARLLQQQMMDVYNSIAPDAGPSARNLIRRIADECYARGMRVSIGAILPPEERTVHHSLDADRRIVWVCKAWAQTLGVRCWDAVGRAITDFLGPHDLPLVEDRWATILRAGKSVPVEFTFIAASGAPLPARAKVDIIRDTDGSFVRTFCKALVYVPRAA